MTEEQKKVAQVITVSAIIIAIIIIVALVYNIVSLVNLNTRNAELQEKVAALEVVAEQNSDYIEYLDSEEFIDRYAREVLGWIGKNDIAYSSDES